MTAPSTVELPGAIDEPQDPAGMVALIPAPEYAVKLAVAGGLPAGELHLTLCYLGDDVTQWPPQIVDAVRQTVVELVDPMATAQESAEDPSQEIVELGAGIGGPLTLNIFAWSQFNPNGGPDGQESCMVYQFDGGEDYNAVADLAGLVQSRMSEAIGEAFFPDQYTRFEPHVTAGYGIPPTALTYTGPVVFDRLRVVLADQTTDFPLGGDGSMAAAALARTPGGSVTAKSRQKAKTAGHTMSDGSFPIENGADLDNAIPLAGKAKDPVKARKWIMSRAKALKLAFKIPDSWKTDGTLQASGAPIDDEQREALTAAATALLERAGPADAYRQAPFVFVTLETLTIADQVIQPPDEDTAITAAADTELPPVDMFIPPADMPPGTGHYVDPPTGDSSFRRVYGRLAEWNIPHIGIDGRKVYPPRSASGYRWFHTKSAWVQGPDGPERLPIGHLTFGTSHASTAPGVSHLAASSHYDNSGFRGAKVRMSEDQYGPVYSGVTVAGLDGPRLEEFSESDTSGDWRRIMGNMELVAALCVNVGGFPKIGLSLAASGEPLALVASAKAWGRADASVDYDLLADTIADRIDGRQQTRELSAKHLSLVTELDDTSAVVASLLTEVDDTPSLVAGLLDELADDGLMATGGREVTPKDAENTARLKEYWVHGKGSLKVRWGENGDFDRCRRELVKYVPPGGTLDGLCANLHHDALGVWPGREHGGK